MEPKLARYLIIIRFSRGGTVVHLFEAFFFFLFSPTNWTVPPLEQVIAWLRREHVFYHIAVKEWDSHEPECVGNPDF
jgi:hypothetical protein